MKHTFLNINSSVFFHLFFNTLPHLSPCADSSSYKQLETSRNEIENLIEERNYEKTESSLNKLTSTHNNTFALSDTLNCLYLAAQKKEAEELETILKTDEQKNAARHLFLQTTLVSLSLCSFGFFFQKTKVQEFKIAWVVTGSCCAKFFADFILSEAWDQFAETLPSRKIRILIEKNCREKTLFFTPPPFLNDYTLFYFLIRNIRYLRKNHHA